MRGDQLQGHEDRWLRRKPPSFQVLTGQVKLDSLLQIAGNLVEGRSLCDDGNLETLSDVSGLVSRSNDRLNRPLKHRYPFENSTMSYAIVPVMNPDTQVATSAVIINN